MRLKTAILVCIAITQNILFTGCSSCVPKRSPATYDELRLYAIEQHAKFCVVLTDDDFPIEDYEKKVITDSYRNSVLWTFVNVDTQPHEWFKYLLGTSKTPFTLIFSPNGTLENIVYGISRYACASIWNTLSSDSPNNNFRNFGFLENSIIESNSSDILSHLNDLLRTRNDTLLTDNEKLYIINKSIENIDYPYNSYLRIRLLSHLLEKDSVDRMIDSFINKYATPYYTNVYIPLIQQAERLKKGTPVDSEVKLIVRVDKAECQLSDTAHIEVNLVNESTENITIERIEPSCHCIRTVGKNDSDIPPSQSRTYQFYMLADETGDLYREVYFYTNTGVPYMANFKIHVNR